MLHVKQIKNESGNLHLQLCIIHLYTQVSAAYKILKSKSNCNHCSDVCFQKIRSGSLWA